VFWAFWPLLNAAPGRGKLCGDISHRSDLRFVEIPACSSAAIPGLGVWTGSGHVYSVLGWIKTFINREDILHGYINTANGHNWTTDAAMMFMMEKENR
jgi:hypothetical protein